MFITQKSTDDYTYKPKTNKNSYGINPTSFDVKPNGWKITNPGQSGKASSLNTREKLYDISGLNGRVSVPKIDYSAPKISDFTSNTTKRQGSVIKDNIKNVLAKKYGELDTRHLFDDIDDADIENNISTAQAAIQTNIDKGNLNKDIYSKLPYLLDGMTVSYAAANIGNNKEATRAREAAYTEQSSVTASDNQSKSQPTEYSSFYTDYLENKKTSQTNNSWNKFGNENKVSETDKNPRYVNADVLNMRSAPGTDAKIVGGLTNGTEVHYTGNKTGEIDGHLWAEVTYDGKTGWVAADYLRTAKPQSLSSNNFQNNSISTSQNPTQSESVESSNKGSKLDINNHAALQEAFNNVRKPGATDDDPGEFGDLDGVHGLQCVDLSNWFLENYTTLGRVVGDGKDVVHNIADNNNLEESILPTAPAIYSVAGYKSGPGTSGVNDGGCGHTGVILSCKLTDDGNYELTYFHTYNSLLKKGVTSEITTRTFTPEQLKNTTFINLKNHMN